MVAAIGWGPLSAAIGGIAAASRPRRLLFGLPYCIAYVITVALPAWWLGHLAHAGPAGRQCRAAGNGAAPAAPAMEWYPPGRLLLWIAGFAVLTTIAALLTLGTDAATIAATMRTRPAAHPRPARAADRRATSSDRSMRWSSIAPCRPPRSSP